MSFTLTNDEYSEYLRWVMGPHAVRGLRQEGVLLYKDCNLSQEALNYWVARYGSCGRDNVDSLELPATGVEMLHELGAYGSVEYPRTGVMCVHVHFPESDRVDTVTCVEGSSRVLWESTDTSRGDAFYWERWRDMECVVRFIKKDLPPSPFDMPLN